MSGLEDPARREQETLQKWAQVNFKQLTQEQLNMMQTLAARQKVASRTNAMFADRKDRCYGRFQLNDPHNPGHKIPVLVLLERTAKNLTKTEANSYVSWATAMVQIWEAAEVVGQAARGAHLFLFDSGITLLRVFCVNNFSGKGKKPSFEEVVSSITMKNGEIEVKAIINGVVYDGNVQDHLKQGVELWLKERGYEKKQGKAGYYNSDAPDEQPLSDEIFKGLRDKQEHGFKQFLGTHIPNVSFEVIEVPEHAPQNGSEPDPAPARQPRP